MTEPLESRRRAVVFVLAAIGLLALGLRVFGITYGLPGVYNPDETPILNRALAFAKGDPNPHIFVYPTLYFYVLFAWEGLFYVFGRAAGLFDSVADFQTQFFIDPSRHFLAGRVMTVVAGTLTVAAVYWFGRRLYDRATGLSAAAFMAVSPIAVRDAHYVKLDIPTTLALVVAHAALARIVVDPAAAARRRTWIVAGFLSGLAVSTQYYVAFVAFSMIGVAIADLKRSARWQETGRLFLWSTGAAIAGFFAGTPFILVDLQKAISDIAHVREVDIDRAVVGGPFAATGAYLEILLKDAMGWPVAIAAAVGTVLALVSDWRRGLLLTIFPLTFLAFIANTVPMSRYVNAMLPYVAVAAALAIVAVARRAGRNWQPVCAAAVVAAMIPGLVASIRTDLFIRQADTRGLARDFVHETLPPGSSILIEPQSVPLRQSREALREALAAHGVEGDAVPVKLRLMLELEPYPAPAYRLIYLGDGGLDRDKVYVSQRAFSPGTGLEPLRRLGLQFVILKQAHVRNPELGPLEAALAREGRLIAEFSPYDPSVSPGERTGIPMFTHNTAARIHPALERPGPIVQIWAIDDPRGGAGGVVQ